MNCTSYKELNNQQLLEMIRFLECENLRLHKENQEYKQEYDIGITQEEMEEQYKNYDWDLNT